jgi:hypothetical protein
MYQPCAKPFDDGMLKTPCKRRPPEAPNHSAGNTGDRPPNRIHAPHRSLFLDADRSAARSDIARAYQPRISDHVAR